VRCNGPPPCTTAGATTTYAFGTSGVSSNRAQMVRDSVTTNYSYDLLDRLTAVGTTVVKFDADGNLRARGSRALTNLTTCSSAGVPTLPTGTTQGSCYDQANRLVGAKVAATAATYAYGGDGNWQSKTVGGNTTEYVYGVAAPLPRLLGFGTATSASYVVWGAARPCLRIGPTGAVSSIHADGLGWVRALEDTSAPSPEAIRTYQYDEFGQAVAGGTINTDLLAGLPPER
jgi:hypothetical protein